MFRTYIKIIDNTTSVSSPATLIREGLRCYSRVMSYDESNKRIFFLSKIKIYKDGTIQDPVHDHKTLELFYHIDQSLEQGKKKQALELIENFLLNTQENLYFDDFGKAKQHLGDILYSHRKVTKITPLDILENMGYEKKQLLGLGVLETTLNKTKNCVSSTAFEILVMDALPKKYPEIQKIQYCQDGAIPISSEVINNTGQKNPDYVMSIKKKDGMVIDVASDSKAQKFDTAISNIEKNGNQNNVLTIAAAPDEIITNHIAYRKRAITIKQGDNNDLQDKMDDYPVSPMIPTFFVSTKDIAQNVAKMNKTKSKLVEPKNKEDDID